MENMGLKTFKGDMSENKMCHQMTSII